MNFSWLAVFVFFLFWLLIYFSFSSERKTLFTSFWLLGLYLFWGFKIISSFHFPLAIFFLFYLSAFGLLFLLFGLMNLFFKNRLAIYSFFQNFFLLIIFLIFYYSSTPPYFFPLIFFLFLSLFFLFKEAFSFFGLNFFQRQRLFALFLALAIIEVFWLSGFLSLGFINSALFLTILSAFLKKLILTHLQGKLNLSFVFQNIFLFLCLCLIIFIFSFSS